MKRGKTDEDKSGKVVLVRSGWGTKLILPTQLSAQICLRYKEKRDKRENLRKSKKRKFYEIRMAGKILLLAGCGNCSEFLSITFVSCVQP